MKTALRRWKVTGFRNFTSLPSSPARLHERRTTIKQAQFWNAQAHKLMRGGPLGSKTQPNIARMDANEEQG